MRPPRSRPDVQDSDRNGDEQVPYCETRREQYVVNQRVSHRVAKQVPYTVTRCVPKCVERQVAFEQCYYVPQTVCPTTACATGCATGGCATGNCNTASDAANPQPTPYETDKPIQPRTQPEAEPADVEPPSPKPAA